MAGRLGFRSKWPLWPILFLLPIGLVASYAAWFTVALSPLQQLYLAPYMDVSFKANSTRPFPIPRVWMTGPKRAPQLAEERDVVPIEDAGKGNLPLGLSADAHARGWTGLVRMKQNLSPKAAAATFKEQFFNDQSVLRLFITPLCGMALLVMIYIALREQFGSQTGQEERHGRRTKGPELVSAPRSNRHHKADGIRFSLQGKFGLPARGFRIPKRLEPSHILLMGDTGSGKSNAIRQILTQIQERGEAAIVYDPAGEFVQQFYRPERGDVILNPLDDRCPFWDLNSELHQPENADAIAAAMLPEQEYGTKFFTDAPRRVLARLLKDGPSVTRLLEWMAVPEMIDERLRGTPQAAYLDAKAGPQRVGVLSSLNMIADSLDLLPAERGNRGHFVTEKWKFERTQWVFLTSKPSMRERIRPLHSAWLDLLILRMMEPCVNPAKPVWFVLDELASLNKLPQLHTAVTENRKYGNPVVLGFQGRSQLEKRYGADAEAMLSQPATKIFFKTSEPRAAKWISETLGEVEVERLKESRTKGLIRDKKNLAMEIATKPLVMPSEIAGLESLRAFIKQENRVVPVKFSFAAKQSLQPEFVERKVVVMEPRLLPPLPAQELPQSAKAQPAKPTAAATLITGELPLVTPVVKVGTDFQRFAEAATQKAGQPEQKKPVFKKKESLAREWKPVD